MGRWTFAVVFMTVLGIILLLVPGNSAPPTLDTSQLTEVDEPQGIPKGMRESIPTSYEAPSTAIALDAIPFPLTLPEKLPFDAKPYQVMDLWDWGEKDGEEIKIELMSVAKNDLDKGWVMIAASDRKHEKRNLGSTEKVKLENGIIGRYKANTEQENSSIQWMVNGVYYLLNYMNKAEKFDKNAHKETLKSLADEMIHNMDTTK